MKNTAVSFALLASFACFALAASAAERQLKTPCQVSFVLDGVGASVDSWGININTGPHWNDIALMRYGFFYAIPLGKTVSLGGDVYKRGEKIKVVLKHYSDHSSVEVKKLASGKTIGYAPLVIRTKMKKPNYLNVKAGEEFVKDLTIDDTLADEKIDDRPPVAPDGYFTVFSDHFTGFTEKWGVHRNCSGVMNIPKKSYFCYSYPILVPGLFADDAIIAFDAFIEDATTLEIRFRASANGDDYYRLVLTGRSRTSGFARKEVGKDVREIGKGSKLTERGIVSFRLAFNGGKMSATVNGRELANAEDDAFAGGSVYVCGSSDSETRLFSFDVFGRKGGKSSWTQARLDQCPAESSVRETAMPEPDAARLAKGDHADKSFLWHEGRPYIPLAGSDGQYFLLYEPEALGDERAWNRIRDAKTLRDIREFGLTWQGVFLRIVDYVDPTKTDHAFTEDYGLGGVSRVMDIAGDKFRVTSARRSLIPYFSYTTCVRKPRKMHVVGVLVPNDIERYLGVFPLPNESGSFGVATGRTFPLDDRNYFTYACYYPRDVKIEWVILNNIFRKYIYEPLVWEGERSGAAVGGVWMMEPIGNETDYLPKVTPPDDGKERQIGDYFQRANFINSNFGVKADQEAKDEAAHTNRMAAFGAWLDHARFAGCNNAQVCWIGTDGLITGGKNNIGYDTKIFAKHKVYAYDFVTEMCPELEKRGMKTIASTATYYINDFAKGEFGLQDGDLRVKPDGTADNIFWNQKLEPASPHVKDFYCEVIKELALTIKDEKSVDGIAISVDGFFTFAGGWGELPLRRFEKECGVELPSYVASNAYHYVTNNAAVLEKWYAWRARDAHDIVCRLRDTIRSVNPEWTLVVRLLTNYSYKFEKKYEDCQREMLLKEGIDPDLYRNEEGIVFATRSFYEHKVAMKPGEWSYQYEHGVMDVPTRFGTGHHQWTGYWESPGMFTSFSKYTYGWLGCPNTLPVGRNMLETFTFHLANENIRIWTYQAWESALEQCEHNLRRMAAAFRALPVAEPKAFAGKVAVEGDLTAADVKVAWYGNRLAIINPSAKSGLVTLSGMDAKTLVELGRGRTHVKTFFGGKYEIEVLPYDLQVFKTGD